MSAHMLETYIESQPLPDRVSIGDIKRVVEQISKVTSAAYYAYVDHKRKSEFNLEPVWCIDFSEIRAYIENSGKHQDAHVLIDHLITEGKQFVLLPGTLREILSYLENLIKKHKLLSDYEFSLEELKESVLLSSFPDKTVEEYFHKIIENKEGSFEAVAKKTTILESIEPAAFRLALLIKNDRCIPFYKVFPDPKILFSFPGRANA